MNKKGLFIAIEGGEGSGKTTISKNPNSIKVSNINNKNPIRDRKLLLHKNEILRLQEDVRISGNTLVPLKLYFKGNKAKILLGVCKGKKLYDKRETIKERDLSRETKRVY